MTPFVERVWLNGDGGASVPMVVVLVVVVATNPGFGHCPYDVVGPWNSHPTKWTNRRFGDCPFLAELGLS